MSVRTQQTPTGLDIIFEGFENGVAPSPFLGIQDMRGVLFPFKVVFFMTRYAKTNPVIKLTFVLPALIRPMVHTFLGCKTKLTFTWFSKFFTNPNMKSTITNFIAFPRWTVHPQKVLAVILPSASKVAKISKILLFAWLNCFLLKAEGAFNRNFYFLRSATTMSRAESSFAPNFSSSVNLKKHLSTKITLLTMNFFHLMTRLTPTRFASRSALGAAKLLMN